MGSRTLLKNDGIFVYEDYLGAKASRRLREDLPVDGVQPIRRTSNALSPAAVLVSASWFDTQITGFAQNGDDLPDYKVRLESDDALGRELSTFVDLVNDTLQIESRLKRFNHESRSHNQYLVVGFYDTAAYLKDVNPLAPLNNFSKKGGLVMGYLLPVALYDLLKVEAAPDARGLLSKLNPAAGTLETITLVCTAASANGGTFSVTGSVSGVLPALTVGMDYSSPPVSMLLMDGTQDFIVSDTYTIVLVSANL